MAPLSSTGPLKEQTRVFKWSVSLVLSASNWEEAARSRRVEFKPLMESLQRSVRGQWLWLKMTDAVTQQQVTEVKLRSMEWPFHSEAPSSGHQYRLMALSGQKMLAQSRRCGLSAQQTWSRWSSQRVKNWLKNWHHLSCGPWFSPLIPVVKTLVHVVKNVQFLWQEVCFLRWRKVCEEKKTVPSGVKKKSIFCDVKISATWG